MAAGLPKGRCSPANSGTKVAVLLGVNMRGSFPLLSALQIVVLHHSYPWLEVDVGKIMCPLFCCLKYGNPTIIFYFSDAQSRRRRCGLEFPLSTFCVIQSTLPLLRLCSKYIVLQLRLLDVFRLITVIKPVCCRHWVQYTYRLWYTTILLGFYASQLLRNSPSTKGWW